MRGWKSGFEGVLAGLLLLPAVALAQPILQQRCVSDSLVADLIEARVEWMRRCALAKVGNPGLYFDTGLIGADGRPLYDYQEADPYTNWSGQNTYTGASFYFWINESYVSLLYLSGMTYQTTDANGYYKWYRSASRKKARPMYPTYGSQYDINSASNVQLFPHPTLANCTLYTDRYGINPAPTFYVNGYCESSAYPLTNGTPVGPLANAADSRSYYVLSVPAGVTQLTIETSGGTGDVDLYVKANAGPTLYSYDCRPYRGGNSEICNFANPAAGTWYIMLHGYSAYSGVTLTGRYQ